jgi:hypothetical protein
MEYWLPTEFLGVARIIRQLGPEGFDNRPIGCREVPQSTIARCHNPPMSFELMIKSAKSNLLQIRLASVAFLASHHPTPSTLMIAITKSRQPHESASTSLSTASP